MSIWEIARDETGARAAAAAKPYTLCLVKNGKISQLWHARSITPVLNATKFIDITGQKWVTVTGQVKVLTALYTVTQLADDGSVVQSWIGKDLHKGIVGGLRFTDNSSDRSIKLRRKHWRADWFAPQVGTDADTDQGCSPAAASLDWSKLTHYGPYTEGDQLEPGQFVAIVPPELDCKMAWAPSGEIRLINAGTKVIVSYTYSLGFHKGRLDL